MKITDIPFAAMRLQYRIARAPLQFIEERVIARMDPEAPGRLLFERSVGSIDAMVGTVLRDDDVASRGAAQVQRSEALAEAIRLDEAAAQQRADADEELRRKQEEVAAAPSKARKRTLQKVEDARSTAEKRKHRETENAAKRTEEAKFMPGVWVFPGGSVDDGDGEDEARFKACAVRELEEERELFAELAVRHERARIASELHDIVGHAISVMVIQAAAGQRLVERDPVRAEQVFTDLAESARQGHDDLRRLVELLGGMEVGGPDLSLIEEIVTRAARSGLDVSCRFEGSRDGVSAPAAHAAFRVVQESLTNALRYAPGAAVRVAVNGSGRDLTVKVENDDSILGDEWPSAGQRPAMFPSVGFFDFELEREQLFPEYPGEERGGLRPIVVH